MTTAFNITASGTTIKGTDKGHITLSGRNAAQRTESIIDLITYLADKAGFNTEFSRSGNAITFTPIKHDPEHYGLIEEHLFSKVFPNLQETMKQFEIAANARGFDAAIAEMTPKAAPARKPAALQFTEKKPITLTDEELRGAIGKGLVDANVDATQIKAAVDKAMEAIAEARKQKASLPPRP